MIKKPRTLQDDLADDLMNETLRRLGMSRDGLPAARQDSARPSNLPTTLDRNGEGAPGTVQNDKRLRWVLDEQLETAVDTASSPEAQQEFVASILKQADPQDNVEVMLRSQMAVCHSIAMKMASRLAEVEGKPEHEKTYFRMSHQAQQLFCTQMQTLKRHRAVEQKIVVQHVSVSEGSQAIVGDVTAAPSNAQKQPLPNVPAAEKKPK